MKDLIYFKLLIAVIILLGCSSETSKENVDLVISNINLIDGTGSPLAEHANIYIHDGRVKKINFGNQEFQADTIVDGTGKFMIPGLFDNHFHLGSEYNRRLKIMVHFGITNVFAVGGTH